MQSASDEGAIGVLTFGELTAGVVSVSIEADCLGGVRTFTSVLFTVAPVDLLDGIKSLLS